MPRRKPGEGKELRRQFTQEFKREAVRLVEADARPIAAVARELGVRADLLRAWVRQAQGLPGRTARAGRMPSQLTSQLTSQDEELRRLKRENAELREERDILGKAMAFFARTTR